MAGEVVVEQRGRVALATLANPPHGLIDSAMVDALDRLVRRAEEEPGIGAVVLTGSHPQRFIAHYDVEELLRGSEASPSVSPRIANLGLRGVGAMRKVPRAREALTGTPVAGLEELERFHELFLRMQTCGAVFIAALNGSVMGGGCELALACDFRLMSRGEFVIGQPEILLGFPPGGGGTQRLARLVGTRAALRLCLDGGPLRGEEAVEIGLVDRLVDPERLLEEAIADATHLAARVKAAVAAAKRAIYEGGSRPLAEGLRLERAEFTATIATDEAREAMRAYVDALRRTGELPAYDRSAIDAALARGRFE
jgi:enoyl-CoA hydratase